MRVRLVRLLATVLSSLSLVTAGGLAATGITGGGVDGNGHPNVGMLVAYDVTGRFRCSATLVSPTVVLTAAHCTIGTLGRTAVTFDSTIASQAPAPLPQAADLDRGLTAAEVAQAGAGYVSGTAHTHPQYSDFTDMKNWNDVGVIVLDSPVTTIDPARIAPRGYLDRFAQPKLNSTVFTSVGYGTEVRTSDGGAQKPTPMSYPIVRRYAQEPGQKLTGQILTVNGNNKDPRGTGGTCFGDSGGPTFLDGYVVTVTSYAFNGVCRYIDGLQRVDIGPAQNWLASFDVWPAG